MGEDIEQFLLPSIINNSLTYMKKVLLISGVLTLVLVGLVIYLNLHFINQPSASCSVCTNMKKVTIHGLINGVIDLNVPIGWNTYTNGDSQPLDIKDIVLDVRTAVTSVASEDRPVTVTDLNWQQLDFYLTDGDLIGLNFVSAITNTANEKMENVKTKDFEGYSITTTLPAGELPSKANTGGTTYYLRLRSAQPTWNLIINKQALGDDNFETEVPKIIGSLRYTQQ